ncbi:SusC/RagA family TonB-linked outer membrane protein [uncultured Roseivirga sp.]|uniref:SusC/RagA family TonB-linked outer membrane protein n=1 Tax=uncultured Roseivirga sp. TaxID=543088 RepID=UPI000D79696B|nr:SusC/RagA family TonB-linked outer membrane protein [uncultured Roseivirga sp.]PWL31274.1 MAG: hypothetical protein DCO95_07310 [Roseivirga sp. XM-24bin3]
MKRVLLTILSCALFLVSSMAFAQDRTVSGKVTGTDDGLPLPQVNILIKGTTNGTFTDMDGNYSLTVPSGSTLIFRYLGYVTQEILVNSQTVVNVQLAPDATSLGEVVVTGVAVGTDKKNLGFGLSQVKNEQISAVPALDASNTLRGKVAGITIVQSQGDGGASVSLRGAKSVFGNISPLIIVDGILTQQNLSDINTDDIESIEVIKGAAASSLYGSLAAGGVIQIRTKRGAQGKEGIRIQYRGEYGISEVENVHPTASTHPFKILPNGDFDLTSGSRELTDDGTWNPYPSYNDNFSNLISKQPYYMNLVSVQNSLENYSFYMSAQHQTKGMISDVLDPEERLNVRMNFDIFPSEKFTAKISTSYQQNTLTPVSRGGQGTFFSDALLVEPFIDFTERDEDGDYAVFPTGFDVVNSNVANPLYQYENWEYDDTNERFVVGLDLRYQLTDNISFNVTQSIDKFNSYSKRYYPKGYKTATPNATLNNGNYSISNNRESYSVTSAQMNFNKKFGDFNVSATTKFLHEYNFEDGFNANGRELVTNGVYDLGALSQDNRNIGSYQRETVSKNAFLSTDVIWKDKLIFNGLVRRDGSSRFGEKERWQTFGRVSLAYRITQDYDLPIFDELKVRASYGSAGRRPTWSAQYETFSVSSSGISGSVLGNANLIPAVNKELEIGIDGEFLNRFDFQINYASSVVENDFIQRRLSAVTGYNTQYQNLGAVESTAFEFQMGAEVMNKSNFRWDANMTFDIIRSEITDLAGIPPFTNGYYRVETGEPVGTFYGNKLITSLDQLETDGSGNVINAWNADGIPLSEFSVNNLGYVVLTDDIGTPQETAFYFNDPDNRGAKLQTIIGDRNPDFKVGLSNTLTFFNNLQLYFLIDWKQGGDKYNATNQYLYFNTRAADQEEYARLGHHTNFSISANSLYNGNLPTSHFVEDGTFVKIRELSMSYTFKNPVSFVEDVRLSLIGRNLLTFSNYGGFDPEGYDENFDFPLYRNYTVSLQIRF